jgi:hypothetical protein
MSDENLLLDHARRYFTQAGQTDDMKKIKMLAELGGEFLRLAQHGARPCARADAQAAPAEAAGQDSLSALAGRGSG